MAVYLDEEEVWKCQKHPSKRRRTGICHVCLRERLSSLCPDCANARPCACSAASTSSSSSSSIGSVGRLVNLINSEPSFRRSRSVAVIPFLWSKPPVDQHFAAGHDEDGHHNKHSSARTIWSLFKGGSKSKRCNAVSEQEAVDLRRNMEEGEERRKMMRKSRSVAVTSVSGQSDARSGKGRSWYFPSPIKAFKHSISKGGIMVQERSPMHRG